MNNLKSVAADSALSPIADKLISLADLLAGAHTGLNFLEEKLTPVRAIGPQQVGKEESQPPSACEVEARLEDMIRSASMLCARLSDLRGEIRC